MSTKCGYCGAEPDTLQQVVVQKTSDLDTSAFTYEMVCADCVEAKGLQRSVVQRKSKK